MKGFIIIVSKNDKTIALDKIGLMDYFNEGNEPDSSGYLDQDKIFLYCSGAKNMVLDNHQYIAFVQGKVFSDTNKLKNIELITILLESKTPYQIGPLVNGDYFIFIYNRLNGSHFFITDRGGFIPAYCCETDDFCVISSHPDAIAKLAGKQATGNLDLVSMAEFLHTSRIEFPNTYYDNIKQLPAGSCSELSNNKIKTTSYWSPTANFIYDQKDLTKQLSLAIRAAVSEATDSSWGSHGIFLSGGADSRAILFSRDKEAELSTATFFDQPNDEFFTAQKLAQRAGVKHIGLRREFEHYGNSAFKYVSVTQGMMGLADNHYLSFLPEINTLGVRNWHTGCFVDWFFKGIAFNTSYKTLLGKPLPTWQVFSDFQYTFHTYACEISQEFKPRVLKRIYDRYKMVDKSKINDDLNLWELEKLRLWPINREFTFGSRMSLFAYLNWHPILSQNGMLEMWSKIPPRLKLNGVIWKKAVAEICKGNNDIRDNNWGSYLGHSPQINSLFFLLKILQRKLKNRDKTSIATTGSWPNFATYLSQSQVLIGLWENHRMYSETILTELIGYNPFNFSPSEWAKKDVVFFMRLISLHLWLYLYHRNFKHSE